MPDDIMMAVATALAGKVAAALASGGSTSLASLARLVRKRFGGDPAAQTALESAQERPDDQSRTQSLRDALEQAATADPEFGEQLRALWRQASTELNASHGGVINQVSGTVSGNVVQAHDIHGNLTFGDVPRRDA
jgi:hypothetical protein